MNELIEVDELAALLASEQPPIVADVRWTLGAATGRRDFETEHIPGAHWVDLETELSAPPGEGGRHPLPSPEVFQQAMRRIGVSSDGQIVVCDANSSLAASRLWWLLTDAGFDNVSVLNGGVAAWKATGKPLESAPSTPVAPGDFEARPGQRSQISGEALWTKVDSGTAPVIVDVRGAERFSGEVEPIDPVAGHIPGAVNAPSMLHLDPDGRYQSPGALRERFAKLGVDGDAVLYCGSGITAAHSLLAMEIAGLVGATVYPGSWSDWISDPERGVASGA